MTTNLYKVKQARLYLAIRLILNSIKQNLPMFSSFKSKYTLGWITSFLADTLSAEQLPDDEARTLTHESKRKEAIVLGEICLSKWRALKRYIYDTYSSPEMYYNAAGWNYYAAAAGFTFECLKQLMIEGSKFIHEHSAELMAGNNMPAGFEDEFNDAKAAMEQMLEAFYAAEQEAMVGTSKKIDANNDIYTRIISGCLDGQHIFENDEELKKQFSFEYVCSLISPDGASAVKFKVLNNVTGLPMAGVEILKVGSDKMVVTNENGEAEMTQLANETTTFIITADGFNEKQITLELTGTTKHEEVRLEPMFEGSGSSESGTTPDVEETVDAENN